MFIREWGLRGQAGKTPQGWELSSTKICYLAEGQMTAGRLRRMRPLRVMHAGVPISPTTVTLRSVSMARDRSQLIRGGGRGTAWPWLQITVCRDSPSWLLPQLGRDLLAVGGEVPVEGLSLMERLALAPLGS